MGNQPEGGIFFNQQQSNPQKNGVQNGTQKILGVVGVLFGGASQTIIGTFDVIASRGASLETIRIPVLDPPKIFESQQLNTTTHQSQKGKCFQLWDLPVSNSLRITVVFLYWKMPWSQTNLVNPDVRI